MTRRRGRGTRARCIATVGAVVASVALALGVLGPSWQGLVVAVAVAWFALGLGLAWFVGGAASLRDRKVLVLGPPREATSSDGC